MKKTLLLVLMATVIAAYLVFDLQHHLSLAGLKALNAEVSRYYLETPVLITVAFIAFYTLVTASSLPGAAILTLAGGAFFGLGIGTAVVSVASVCGATLSFLIARFLLHDAVQKRLGKRLAKVNAGIERDGAFYLFTLRLVPIFPFFLVNPLMALTPIRLWTYIWVSWIGMLPATAVYVNAGTQLAQLDSLSGILAPSMLLAFVLLGIFPLIAKWVLGWVLRQRVYRRWTKPRRFDRNMIVIGAGAAGLVSSLIGATVRARVSLVEAEKMGGDCLNYGCVPSKALIASARVAHVARTSARFGITAGPVQVDFPAVMQRVRSIIEQIEPHDSVERYQSLGVDVISGYATITDPWTVSIRGRNGDDQVLTTRSIVIAAGASPTVPHLPGLERSGYLTSDTLWEAMSQRDRAPERLLVVGGGPVGCELAQAFSRLGSQVILVHAGDHLLVREDPEVADVLRQRLLSEDVQIHLNARAIRCDADRKVLVVKTPTTESEIAFDDLLIAVGRNARLTGYGLEQLGIDTNRTVTTNEYLETLYPNILAAGDVAGPYQFTHAAAHQAWFASVNALFGHLKRFRADYTVLPAVTYTDPEIASVGLNERSASAQSIAYEVSVYGLDELDRAICDSKDHGFIKILTVPGKDRILGATIVGDHAGELLTELTVAMKHGLGLNQIMGTVHPYPTLSEANKYAAGEWKRQHAPEWALVLLERYHRWRRG